MERGGERERERIGRKRRIKQKRRKRMKKKMEEEVPREFHAGKEGERNLFLRLRHFVS